MKSIEIRQAQSRLAMVECLIIGKLIEQYPHQPRLALFAALFSFAIERSHDNHHVLFISAAMALEARAHALATTPQAAAMELERANALHAPVDRLV